MIEFLQVNVKAFVDCICVSVFICEMLFALSLTHTQVLSLFLILAAFPLRLRRPWLFDKACVARSRTGDGPSCSQSEGAPVLLNSDFDLDASV